MELITAFILPPTVHRDHLAPGSLYFSAVDSVFPADGPKRAVLAVFRALRGQNGTYTFGHSPRRSDAPAEPGAPRPPFSHMIVGV